MNNAIRLLFHKKPLLLPVLLVFFVLPFTTQAKAQLITCPSIQLIEQQESTAKEIWRWWAHLNFQDWIGEGVDTQRLLNLEKITAQLEYHPGHSRFLTCTYKNSKNQKLGILKTINPYAHCKTLPRTSVDNKRVKAEVLLCIE